MIHPNFQPDCKQLAVQKWHDLKSWEKSGARLWPDHTPPTVQLWYDLKLWWENGARTSAGSYTVYRSATE